jgi:3-oxoacyl-[acyl-carrier-protein] synthase II
MRERVVITGIGMVTPLGDDPAEVLRRVEAGDRAGAPPLRFDARPFACPVCAQVRDFQPHRYVSEAKLLRLMNRDAQLAVAAARLALRDARLNVGTDYQPDEIALFGATSLAGLPLAEVIPLLRASAGPGGEFDLARFGQAGLKAVSPVLSFKILSNMPVCFVSICENLQGPNAIYTPWEGQGAQAIEAGAWAIQCGDAPCALVGGCDVKTHELAFVSLQQQGIFDSWKEQGAGVMPGEGAVFLVLESARAAAARSARVHACLAESSFCSRPDGTPKPALLSKTLSRLRRFRPAAMVAAGEDDQASRQDEAAALAALGIEVGAVIHPKPHAGNLFAAAAVLQVALGALLAERLGLPVLANCFGHGSEQAAFALEAP